MDTSARVTHLCKKPNINQATRRETPLTPILRIRMSKREILMPGQASTPSSSTGKVPLMTVAYQPGDHDDIAGMILHTGLADIMVQARHAVRKPRPRQLDLTIHTRLSREVDANHEQGFISAMKEYYLVAIVPSEPSSTIASRIMNDSYPSTIRPHIVHAARLMLRVRNNGLGVPTHTCNPHNTDKSYTT